MFIATCQIKIYLHMEWGKVLRAFVIMHTFTITWTVYQYAYYNNKLDKTQSAYILTHSHSNHFMFHILDSKIPSGERRRRTRTTTSHFVCILMCSKWLQVNISHFAKNHFETILWRNRNLQYKLFGRERVTVYHTSVLDVRYTVVSDVYWGTVLNVYELQRQIFLTVGEAMGFF